MAIYVVDRLTTRKADPTLEHGIYTRFTTPAGALTDLGFWLKADGSWIEQGSTVVLPVYPGGRDQLVSVVRGLGWDTQPTEGGWFTCRRRTTDKTTRVLHLCVLDWLDRGDPVVGSFRPMPGDNWEVIAREIGIVLVAWQKTMGTAYRHTPGVAAHDSIRAQYRPNQPRWAPYRGGNVLNVWSAPFHIRPMMQGIPSTDNGVRRVKFDQRQAYLAAMSAVILPREGLKNTGVEPEGPGYLRAWPDDSNHPLWTLVSKPDRQGCVRLGTSTARCLTDAGATHRVVDSWTAPGSRLLRTWTERVLKLPAGIAKPVYTQAHGLMNTKTGSIQREDWYDLVIDQANATMIRRVWAVWNSLLKWPTTIHVDALEYSVDTDRDIDNLGQLVKVGPRCGEMKVEETQ